MKFAAVSPVVAQLAALFLKSSLWKLGPGVDLFGIGDIPPLKTKIPAGAGTHFFTKESYHTSDRLVKYQNQSATLVPFPARPLLLSAVGAANVSPARKGWER